MRERLEEGRGQPLPLRGVHQDPALAQEVGERGAGELIDEARHLQVGQPGVPAPELGIPLRVRALSDGDESDIGTTLGELQEQLGPLASIPSRDETDRRPIRLDRSPFRDLDRRGEKPGSAPSP